MNGLIFSIFVQTEQFNKMKFGLYNQMRMDIGTTTTILERRAASKL